MQRILAIVLSCCTLALLAIPVAAFADISFAQFLTQEEQQYQLPAGILWKIALAENGGKATGCASTSSACGMFQFITSTWENDTKALFGQPMNPNLRNDPDISAKAAAYELAVIRSQIGGLITQANVNVSAGLYLGYFLGSGGARTLLTAYIQNPSQSACALLPAQCSANRSVMASQTLAGLINWASQKMSVSGVPNVAGNFACSDGTSYAYSYCDVNSSNFLPANTVIPANPYGQSATVFPSATNGAASPILSGTAAPISSLPAISTPVTTTGSGSACTPQYSCANNTVTYESDSCTTSVFQTCQYGCLGTICAPAPSAASSTSGTSSGTTNNQPIVANIPTAVIGGTSATASFFATSTSIGTSTFSIVSTGYASDSDTAQTTGGDSYTPSSSGTSTMYEQDTFGSNLNQSYQSYASQTVSPVLQLLNQLKSVLSSLLGYLQSL